MYQGLQLTWSIYFQQKEGVAMGYRYAEYFGFLVVKRNLESVLEQHWMIFNKFIKYNHFTSNTQYSYTTNQNKYLMLFDHILFW